MVLAVIPAKKVLTEDAGVLDRAETIGKLRSVLESFELTFGVGIVIRDMRPIRRRHRRPPISELRIVPVKRLGRHPLRFTLLAGIFNHDTHAVMPLVCPHATST